MANARKRIKLPVPQTPREMNEIEQEYGKLVSQAGQAQYNIAVYTEDLGRINAGLKNLNYEAAARKELDAKNASQTEEKSNANQG